MRDKKFGYVQWDFSSQTGSTKCVPDRCFIGLLGCSSPGTINRKNRSFQERKWHINKLELLAVKLAHQTFLKGHTFISYLNKIYVFEKNGGNQELKNDYTVKRNLGNINFRTDHDYCGVPTQFTQQSGRFGISSQSGLIRMGPLLTGLLQSLPYIWNPNSIFIHFKGVTASSTTC